MSWLPMARKVPLFAAEAPRRRRAELSLVAGEQHYADVILRISKAEVAVWIATANLKDLRLEAEVGTRARARGRFISILQTLDELRQNGVDVRVLHAGIPSRPFLAELRRHKGLSDRSKWLRCCPRVHLKVVIIDGTTLYLGSANLTGAGMGARAPERRNFELGILTDDSYLLDSVQALFDSLWQGQPCAGCGMKKICPKPIASGNPPA
jgi:phosphatidylserine/phosphatidylglycerophosphate/cardiolipin synthase-like enzyme